MPSTPSGAHIDRGVKTTTRLQLLARACTAWLAFCGVFALANLATEDRPPLTASAPGSLAAAPLMPDLQPQIVRTPLAVDPNVVVPGAETGRGGARAGRLGAQAAATGSPSALMASGIPTVAYQAYLSAAARANAHYQNCHISWTLLAAIGRVESNHGRFNAQLYGDGTSYPPIIGVPLNGNGTGLVTDTDGGALDGDTTLDHAIGPMQFIPSTWRTYGVDASGDHKADPFNIIDAAAASADFLCANGGDVGTSAGRTRAVLAYNPSQPYLAAVTALADSYAAGTPALVPTPGVHAVVAKAKPGTPGAKSTTSRPAPRSSAPGTVRPGTPGSSTAPGSAPAGPGTTAAPAAPGSATGVTAPTDPYQPVYTPTTPADPYQPGVGAPPPATSCPAPPPPSASPSPTDSVPAPQPTDSSLPTDTAAPSPAPTTTPISPSC